MNPLDELKKLTELFPEGAQLVARAEHVPPAVVPEPYQTLLVHDHHMTVAMERHCGCPVELRVLDRRREGNVYSRKIILLCSKTGRVVQFGIVRFDLSYVTEQVRDEILKGETPLGRILIDHNVMRHIDLGAVLRITPGPALAKLFAQSETGVTYGRLATIFCNGRPAVDLLEIPAPV